MAEFDARFKADILAQLQNVDKNTYTTAKRIEDIDNVLNDIAAHMKVSLSNARNQTSRSDRQNVFRNRRDSSDFDLSWMNSRTFNISNIKRRVGSLADEFFDGLEDEMMSAFTGNTLRGHVEGIFTKLEEELEVSVQDIPKLFGKALGRNLSNNSSVNNLVAGMQQKFFSGANSILDRSLRIRDSSGNFINTTFRQQATNITGAFKSAHGSAIASGLGGEAATVEGFSAALAEAGPALATIAPYAAVAVGGLVALDLASKPLTESLKKLPDDISKMLNRSINIANANIDSATKRITSDIETMVRTPFEILEKAATEWYNAWDNNLRVINATQGYNKADLQTLMGNYAERLRSEGLSDYVSAADLTNNLANVLKSGLSGEIAEEFAYIATKLNAAVPTQDFFGYASDYASIIANAQKDGMSQSAAIAYANDVLTKSASNVLYASRELTNGVATGLKDAQAIFEKSIQIAQTSRTGNAVEIQGVLTSVAAVVGAVAPDLASSLTDAVYKAAVGGNSSEIVALRSLAGINASNTEFLRQLTENPQKVFANLFERLAQMQNMSSDAYMEVAEGLSSIFGIQMEAFARVDFNYLARAIASMSVSNNAIEDNINLLKSGQTTTTAEQLKMQQINKAILDEGLAYVLDNEAARAIQQHMWDEQIARELESNTYGVEIQGDALKVLYGISATLDNLAILSNPIEGLKRIGDVKVSSEVQKTYTKEIAKMLELGKVGTGQEISKQNLLSRNKKLDLIPTLVELLGGENGLSPSAWDSFRSRQRDAATDIDGFKELVRTTIANRGSFTAISSLLSNRVQSAYTNDVVSDARMSKINESSVNSMYSWGTVGKSTANSIFSTPSMESLFSIADLREANAQASNTNLAQAKANQNLQRFIDSMDSFVKNDTEHKMTYADWQATAKRYGISDLDSAIANAGITDETLQGHFGALQAQIGAQMKLDRENREEEFWNVSKDNIVNLSTIADIIRQTTEDQLLTTIDFKDMSETLLTSIFDMNHQIYDKFNEFYASWVDYYVNHTAYSAAYDHKTVSEIQRAEKAQSEDAVYALADALTQNSVDLLDPTVQQNALLAQILKVTNAILNATNTPGSTAIPDSLFSMATGATTAEY